MIHHTHAYVVHCRHTNHWATRLYFDQERPTLCPKCHGPVKTENLTTRVNDAPKERHTPAGQ